MGTTRDIAEFAYKTSFEDFDPAVVKHIKNVLLSGVGMTLAGVGTKTGRAVVGYVKDCAAPQEAGVLGTGLRTSTEYAALANGTAAHATELEDDTFPEGTYSVGIFPGILALGEKLHISGPDVLESFVIAWDVASKLGLASIPMLKRGLLAASAYCTIGVTAASAKMLKLGVDGTVMAVSVAASHACGLVSQTGSGAHLYEAGLSGRNAIAAAMLAKHGLTGQPDILEIPMGYLDAVAGVTYPDLKLGEPYRVRDIGIKRYPCCFVEMHPIEGVLELIRTHRIVADEVESVQVHVYPGLTKVVRFHHPKDQDEARFSLPHSIACCFLDGTPWMESYTTERANDPQVIAFRNKVRMVVHPEWDGPGLAGGEIPITIRLKDGREYQKICPKATDPIEFTDAEVVNKYMRSTQGLLSQERAERVAEIVLSLEKVEDITELMTLLTFPDKP
ncbi:MAG: MmgE/PrpD family protein [Chloroflexota bacterium]|nr:MAG: MmgE/PrpD family protein [Chloroflexota bacterium]